MDRDGRWNRGRGHARVPGDCSHWLENRVKRGETWQGFGGRGENRGWPMSINGSPSTACLPFSPPLFLPVHNNFDSRVIIAFSKNKSFRKNISIILGIAISNHFFFIRWLHLFLTRTFCLSASFFVSVFFFFLIRHDFTLPLLYLCGFNAWLHFSSSLTTTRLFSISNPPFSFISPPPQSRSSIELSSTPAKSGQRTLSHLSNRICLHSVPSISSFPFSHTFEKKNRSPKQILNLLYLSPHTLHLSAVSSRKNPRASRFSEIEISSNRIFSFRSLDTFRKFISPSDWSGAIKSTGPIWPEIVSFWLTGGQAGDHVAFVVESADHFDRIECRSGSCEIVETLNRDEGIGELTSFQR